MSRATNSPNPANPPVHDRLSTAVRELIEEADRQSFRPPWLVERLAAVPTGPGAAAGTAEEAG